MTIDPLDPTAEADDRVRAGAVVVRQYGWGVEVKLHGQTFRFETDEAHDLLLALTNILLRARAMRRAEL